MSNSDKLADLKQMNNNELKELAADIRTEIIDVTSKNGGHLASNLGVVELTIALHKVFDSPKDKIIFDVSHQTYTHKILTGRDKPFDTLRQMDGISGFARYSESEHDAFEAGHSSTAISAGLGYLEAKKTYPNDIGEIIAVVGDASISNGLSFEALNYLGAHPEQKMIIIINDNNMSVSKNVGTIANKYNSLRIKKSLRFLKMITPVRIKHAMQYYAYKVDVFTSLGFHYFENINGHDFKELIRYLTYAKNANKSVILHVKTIKGKGYKFAENDETGLWHSVGPFDITTGKPVKESAEPIFGEVLSDALCEYEKNDVNKALRVISPAMILGSGLGSFQKEYPDLMIDTGIAEENAVLMAGAMGHAGLKPVVFIYSTFLQRAYDEVIHDIARSNTHVVICIDHAGIVPGDGDTHQGIFDMAYLNAIPGLTILQPANRVDAKKMLNYALDEVDGPVIIRYPKGSAPLKDSLFTDSSKAFNIVKEGKDYLITYGPDFYDIKEHLENEFNDLGFIYANKTTPLDEEVLKLIAQNKTTLYVYEEVISNGSLGVNILEFVNNNKLDIDVKLISLKPTYLEVGTIKELKNKYHIDYKDIIETIKKARG